MIGYTRIRVRFSFEGEHIYESGERVEIIGPDMLFGQRCIRVRFQDGFCGICADHQIRVLSALEELAEAAE